MSDHQGPVVVKIGGSLFDVPDLGHRLRRWLDASGLIRVVLVPGGGPLADAVRALDRRQNLGEEASHWLALQAMGVSASFLARILPGGVVVRDLAECPQCWLQKLTPILDALPFAVADEGKPGCLPHSWEVTSDSLAARVAVVLGGGRVILLKSTALPEAVDWSEAGRRGFVDRHFGQLVRGSAVEVQVVNLRTWQA
jgi:aspartokinase-like uncharacterized kinase